VPVKTSTANDKAGFYVTQVISYVYVSLAVLIAEDLKSATNFITVILFPFQIINIGAT
jgi:hypothetical protein